uniref:Uncharacterized protein n=1 Tax=Sphaerodactylus townsendi TaxID=933632 RepID=A0ACB8EDZ9_9SAUR
MMEGNQQLALRIDGAIQAAGLEVSTLRAELTATNRRLAELSAAAATAAAIASPAGSPNAAEVAAGMESNQHSLQDCGLSTVLPKAHRQVSLKCTVESDVMMGLWCAAPG